MGVIEIMDKKKMKLYSLIFASLAAVLFVVMLVAGILYSASAITKIVLFVIAAFVLLLAVELGFMFILFGEDKQKNYFLYDPATGRCVSPNKLTFAMVNVKMNKYLSAYATSEGKLWTDGVLADPSLAMNDVYKPLVAYKLLFDLADRDFETGWKCFAMASAKTVEFIAKGLDMNGDTAFASKLRNIKSADPVNLQLVRELLVRNKKYLQSKMLRYTLENIEKF